METHGSNCFYQSLALNDGPFSGDGHPPEGTSVEFCKEHNVTIAHLAKLTSRATSLGASSPSAGVVRLALERSGGIKSVCIPDELAMQACLHFAGQYCVSTGASPRGLTLILRGSQNISGTCMRCDTGTSIQANVVQQARPARRQARDSGVHCLRWVQGFARRVGRIRADSQRRVDCVCRMGCCVQWGAFHSLQIGVNSWSRAV